jgi:hypothetical protein
VLSQSERQLESLQSIDRYLSFNASLNNQSYAALIEQTRQKLAVYNTLLSTIDDAQREVELAEQALSDLSKRMRINVAARYGEDSREYRMAGGKPRSRLHHSAQTSSTLLESVTPVQSSIENGAKAIA